MSDTDKTLTYEEAKQLCMWAFEGGAAYGIESVRYGVNATAYDWEHWLKKNESLFKPKPTVEDVLREFAADFVGCANCVDDHEVTDAIELFAPKLRLAGDAE